MGNSISAWYGRRNKKPHNVILLGLFGSGKTTMMYQLRKNPFSDNEIKLTIPTIGFTHETMNVNGFDLHTMDVGGRCTLRPLLRHFYQSAEGFIFMIDSTDRCMFEQARDELHRAMNEEELAGIPLLILCNKQDLADAASPIEIYNEFNISKIDRTRMVHIVGCSAINNNDKESLYHSLEWLENAIETKVRRTKESTLAISIEEKREQQQEQETKQVAETKRDHAAVVDFSPYYDKTANPTLKNFDPIKQGTACPFAKAAKLWGGILPPSTADGSLTTTSVTTTKEQATAHCQALIEFVKRSNSGQDLDGFCIELTDPKAITSNDPNDLGDCVREMLTLLADLDPSGENMMRVNYIGAKGWRFRFNKTDFFVTTFAPCYTSTSSRYAYGTNKAFILLQPELSFVRHGLPPDSALTHWEEPKTIRDKTRVAFKKAGQEYHIPSTTKYPMAEHIVKPLRDDGIQVIRWWRSDSSTTRRRNNSHDKEVILSKSRV